MSHMCTYLDKALDGSNMPELVVISDHDDVVCIRNLVYISFLYRHWFLQIRNWQIPSWVYLGCSEIQFFFVSNNYPKFKVAVSIWESKCLFVNKRIAYIRQVNSNLWRLAVQSPNNFTDKIETVRVCATYYYSPKGWVSYYHNRRILKSFRYKCILKTYTEEYSLRRLHELFVMTNF